MDDLVHFYEERWQVEKIYKSHSIIEEILMRGQKQTKKF